MSKAFLYFTKIQGWLPAKVLFKWKVLFENKENQDLTIPKGAMLVSNHKALLDMPMYLELFFKSPIRFLVGDVVYDTNIGFVGWMLKHMLCIRVDRATMDFSFIEESVKQLKQGERIGIFPEGQLPRNGKMSRFTPSYVMIALQANAPIVPVYTDGIYHITKRAHVMVGDRINLREHCSSEHPTKEEIQACNEIVLNKIIEMGRKVETFKAEEKKKKKKVTFIQKLLMDGGRVILSPLILFYRVKKHYVEGEEGKQKIKDLKRGVIAANHQSFADPFVLNASFWYRRFFYTASEALINGVKGVLLQAAGCIKIDRTIADIKAINRCADVLKEDYLLGIFPQGTVAGGEPHSGVFLIAAMADAPIVPTYIKKRKNIFKRYAVVFGRPFKTSDFCKGRLPNKNEMELLTKEFMKRAEECMEFAGSLQDNTDRSETNGN